MTLAVLLARRLTYPRHRFELVVDCVLGALNNCNCPGHSVVDQW